MSVPSPSSPSVVATETKSATDPTANYVADPSVKQSLLSDRAILEHIKRGSVVIFPFEQGNLSTSSYDVTLGRYYFRESPPEPGMGIYNPFSEKMVQRVWGQPLEAELASSWMARTGGKLDNISPEDYIIFLAPGETILGHTNEFLGGQKTVTTMMKARSSLGRNFIEVCKCAGWGDIGYVNRWTMEITNNSRYYSIPLVVGRRIAQIVFFDSDGPIDNGSYVGTGKYQDTDNLESLVRNWKPTACLPKMYLDREIKRGPARDPTALGLAPTPELLGITATRGASIAPASSSSSSSSSTVAATNGTK